MVGSRGVVNHVVCNDHVYLIHFYHVTRNGHVVLKTRDHVMKIFHCIRPRLRRLHVRPGDPRPGQAISRPGNEQAMLALLRSPRLCSATVVDAAAAVPSKLVVRSAPILRHGTRHLDFGPEASAKDPPTGARYTKSTGKVQARYAATGKSWLETED